MENFDARIEECQRPQQKKWDREKKSPLWREIRIMAVKLNVQPEGVIGTSSTETKANTETKSSTENKSRGKRYR